MKFLNIGHKSSPISDANVHVKSPGYYWLSMCACVHLNRLVLSYFEVRFLKLHWTKEHDDSDEDVKDLNKRISDWPTYRVS